MKALSVSSFLLLLFFITSCTQIDKVEPTQTVKEVNSKIITPVAKTDFTYLEEMPFERLEDYEQFLADGNIQHLKDFTPEQIVCIFMNLIFHHNIERLYQITYHNHKLPNYDIFKDEYDSYVASYFDDTYLKYRFYDSIEVNTETKKKDQVTVEIKIIFGSKTGIVAYDLKQEDDVWKMDWYHIMDDFKN